MKRLLVLIILGIAVSANVQAQCGPPLPTPRVAFVSKAVEPGFIRYTFSVTNHATFNNVFFTPGSRTYWHSHDGGQVLHVLAGQGRVCLRGEVPETIGAGDVVFFQPGEEHWHGADQSEYLLHMAISLGGHAWLDPVTDAEYARGSGR